MIFYHNRNRAIVKLRNFSEPTFKEYIKKIEKKDDLSKLDTHLIVAFSESHNVRFRRSIINSFFGGYYNRDLLAHVFVSLMNGSDDQNLIMKLAEVFSKVNNKVACLMLHYSAIGGNIEVFKAILYLLRLMKIDRISYDYLGQSILHNAVLSANPDFVDILIRRSSFDFSIPDSYGALPIHNAAEVGSVELVRYFFELGVPWNLTNSQGRTLLHLSVISDNLELFKYLANYFNHLEKHRDNFGTGLIHLAAAHDSITILKYLIDDLDFNVNSIVTTNGMTPAIIAARANNLQALSYLIDKGCDIDQQDFKGFSPLHHAVLKSNHESAELLVSKGSNVNVAGFFGITPLHVASSTCDLKTVKLLINSGAHVNAFTEDGTTPLEIAIKSVNGEVAEFLISQGAITRSHLKDIIYFSDLRSVFENIFTIEQYFRSNKYISIN
ncbi:MAG: ankyrin repeat domain-containing protein [Candidatus Micrarchaeota archaeon]|nr:ankyrin repeat domain-containing protein [Candidatus Micrarchaeota archaeon]